MKIHVSWLPIILIISFSVNAIGIDEHRHIASLVPDERHDMREDMMREHQAVLNMVSDAQATHISVTSGSWFAPETWGGSIPTSGSRVIISAGHTVEFNQKSSIEHDTIRIDGVLTFATQADTEMIVDTIVVTRLGLLEIGHHGDPIAQNKQATIIFKDYADLGFITDTPSNPRFDPYKLGLGLVAMGAVRTHGEDKSPVAEFRQALAGDSVIALEQAPLNWKIGDRIVVAGITQDNNQQEERTIAAVDGTSLTLDAPLIYDHLLPRHTKENLVLTAHVINLTRNITFKTFAGNEEVFVEHTDSYNTKEFTKRGHIMMMHSNAIDVAFTAFKNMGRTNKRWGQNNTTVDELGNYTIGLNPIARYPFHLHRAGGAGQPAYVLGSAVDGSTAWGFVNHSSYGEFEHNVAFNTMGAGFASEAGDELGRFDDNIAMLSIGSKTPGLGVRGHGLGSKGKDLGHFGSAFWVQSRMIRMDGNIASGFAHVGIHQWKELIDNAGDNLIDTRSIAHLTDKYNDQEYVDAYTLVEKSGVRGLYENLIVYGGPTALKDERGSGDIDGVVAHTISTGDTRWYAGGVDYSNFVMIGDLDNPSGIGIKKFGNAGSIRLDNMHIEGMEVGYQLTERQGTSILTNAYSNNVVDFEFHKRWNYAHTSIVQGDIQFGELTDTALNGRERTHFDLHFGGKVFNAGSTSYMLLDIDSWPQPYRVYMEKEQQPDYIPYPSETHAGDVSDEWLDKDNTYIAAQFGSPIGGGWIPDTAVKLDLSNNILAEPLTWEEYMALRSINTERLEELFGTNVALGKPAIASSVNKGTYTPDRLVDGDASNYMKTNKELEEWVEVDLLEDVYINAIHLKNRTSDSKRLEGGYMILLDASRNELWRSDALPIQDHYLFEGAPRDFSTLPVRYVRIESNPITTEYLNLSELYVYADALPHQLIPVSATASKENPNGTGDTNNAIDGDIETRWSGEGQGVTYTLELDTRYELTEIQWSQTKGNERPYYFTLQTSTDGINFSDVAQVTTSVTNEVMTTYPVDKLAARYVRFVCNGNGENAWNNFNEIQLWGRNIH
ncbi:discoidin domain-containing protein [Vibrio kyushuensis]|uniref:discoidin domain-containing protein n=1 Tax=Vibrio kyushuensis TaxID=2910249 RepID=UPI003D0C0BDB